MISFVSCPFIAIFTLLMSAIYSNVTATNVLVDFGEVMELECIVSTLDSSYTILWTHGNKTIMTHKLKEGTIKQSKNYTSKFLNEQNIYQLQKLIQGTEDLGIYVCLQVPSSGTPIRTAWILRSRDQSRFTEKGPAKTEVGGTVTLECSFKTTIPVNIHWRHNGTQILIYMADETYQGVESKYIYRMVSDSRATQLEIRNVTFADAGNYSCLLFDANGTCFSTSWTLYVKGIDLHYGEVSAPVGTSVSLLCNLTSTATTITAVRWYRGSNIILHYEGENPSKRKKYKSYKNSNKPIFTLEIQLVGFDDAGIYSCSAFLEEGKPITQKWELKVEGEEVIEEKIVLSVGETARLKCFMDNTVYEIFKWTFDDAVINDDVQNERILMNASVKDAGIYSCFSESSSKGNIQTLWQVQVQGDVHLTLNKSISLENDTLLSTCCAAFGMEPDNLKIEWLLNSKTIDGNHSTYNIDEEDEQRTSCSDLMLRINRFHHRQSLDCLIQYQRNKSASATLFVLYPPNTVIIERHSSSRPFSFSLLSNKDDLLTCVVDANPRPEVRLEKKSVSEGWGKLLFYPTVQSSSGTISYWSLPLSSIGKGSYRCSAENEYGIAPPSQEIKINCVWVCFFDSFQGFVLTMILFCAGLLVVFTIILKVKVVVKEKRAKNKKTSKIVRYQNTCKQNETVLDIVYDNPSDLYPKRQVDERQIADGTGDELIDDDYSFVTIEEHRDLKTQKETNKIRRKPTPKVKGKRRREKRNFPWQTVDAIPVNDHNKMNPVYAAVQKKKLDTQHLYATVQKDKNTTNKPSPNGYVQASTNPTKAELMYAKVKKNKKWRSEL